MTQFRTAVLSVLAWFAPVAAAQYGAPDGNAHPESQLVAEVAEEVQNPFGEPIRTEMTVEDKRAFAGALDLDPLRDLAVFHNGRVKIMDTLAQDSVFTMTGRRKHFDLSRAGGNVEKISFDPMFTLLDAMIDPAHYVDRPTIGVGYLPMRRQILQNALEDQALRDAWLKTGMISPRMADAQVIPVLDAHAGEDEYQRSAGKIDRSLGVFLNSWQNLEMVAPQAADQPWVHVGRLPGDHPARLAMLTIANGWRAGDADKVNSAIAELAQVLPTINPEVYPQRKRALERMYNNSKAFEWGYWIYLFSLVSLVLAFGTGRKWLVALGVSTLIVAMSLHGLGFGLRWAIAERFPIQNQFESMTGVSLFAAIVGFVVMLVKKQWLFGAAAAATGFLILVTATQTGIPGQVIEREAAILNTSVLLKYHVTIVLTSYGLIALGFITSLFYLATHYGHKYFGKSEAQIVAAGALSSDVNEAVKETVETDKPAGVRRTLKDLDIATMTVLQLAFWTLGVGILLGAWWADHSWGRWWAFDPKETWALVTWIVYLIVIHLRMTGLKDRGKTTAWLSVVGFVVMLWTYFGVNLLLPGLHAYA